MDLTLLSLSIITINVFEFEMSSSYCIFSVSTNRKSSVQSYI